MAQGRLRPDGKRAGFARVRVESITVGNVLVVIVPHVFPAVEKIGTLVVEADQLDAVAPGGPVGIGPLEKLAGAVRAFVALAAGQVIRSFRAFFGSE